MNKNDALNLAIDSMRNIVKEKRKTAYFPDRRAKMDLRLKEYDEAIEILEGMKDISKYIGG